MVAIPILISYTTMVMVVLLGATDRTTANKYKKCTVATLVDISLRQCSGQIQRSRRDVYKLSRPKIEHEPETGSVEYQNLAERQFIRKTRSAIERDVIKDVQSQHSQDSPPMIEPYPLARSMSSIGVTAPDHQHYDSVPPPSLLFQPASRISKELIPQSSEDDEGLPLSEKELDVLYDENLARARRSAQMNLVDSREDFEKKLHICCADIVKCETGPNIMPC